MQRLQQLPAHDAAHGAGPHVPRLRGAKAGLPRLHRAALRACGLLHRQRHRQRRPHPSRGLCSHRVR